MNKTGRAKISQCMIVKNEEKNIRQALSWGKEIMAEQIVVDTGSTDRTAEIAQEMGAKVYSFSWIDDFSAAKNFAIRKARYSWIAFLDADEYFSGEDAKKLQILLEKLHPHLCDGVETGWIHLDDEGKIIAVDTQIRIFRNQPDIRYARKIHEHLVAADGRNLKIWSAVEELSIFHTGYGKIEMQEKKSNERNLRLIRKEIEENPDQFEMYGYLGNEYVATGEWEKAKEAYQRAVSLTPDSMHGRYDLETSGFAVRLLELLCALPDTEEHQLLELYQKVEVGWPQEGDYDYLLGNYYAGHRRYSEGERYLKQALDKLEQGQNPSCCAKLAANLIKTYELLAMCCLNYGNRSGCVKYASALLKENPYLMTAAMLFISAFHQDMAAMGKVKDGAAEVAELLGRSFYQFQSLKDRIFVLRAAVDAGYMELAEVIRGLFSPEELVHVDRALNRNNG